MRAPLPHLVCLLSAVFSNSLFAQSDGEIISVDGQSLEVELFPRHLEIVTKLAEKK